MRTSSTSSTVRELVWDVAQQAYCCPHERTPETREIRAYLNQAPKVKRINLYV